MAFCNNCGNQVNDGTLNCPNCGAPIGDYAKQAAPNNGGQSGDFMNSVANFNNTADTTNQYNPQDISNNKVMAILSYIGILVLVPIFAAKESPYARYHANQGLTLLLVDIIWSVVSGILSAILPYFIARTISGLGSLLILILLIIGIVNAAQGKAKELPIIGKIQLLK